MRRSAAVNKENENIAKIPEAYVFGCSSVPGIVKFVVNIRFVVKWSFETGEIEIYDEKNKLIGCANKLSFHKVMKEALKVIEAL